MAEITITEALQEIKTLGKRIEKKRTALLPFVARDARLKDPLEREGGSAKYLRTERQSIGDLENRIVAIRTAIQAANNRNTLTLQGKTYSVSEWLNWRRDISAGQQQFINRLIGQLALVREQLQRPAQRGVAVAVVQQGEQPVEAAVNLDEKELLAEADAIESMLGELDGKLSLFNATCKIDV